MRSLSVRAKLTLWYLAVISTALLFFGLLSFGALRYALTKLKHSTLSRREQRLVLFLDQNKQKHSDALLSEQLENYVLITHEGNLFQIRDLQGSLIFPLNPAGAAWLPHPATECAQPAFGDLISDGQPLMVVCHTILLDERPVRLYIGGSLEDDMYLLSIYRKTLLLLVPCLLGVAAVGGYFLSRHAMRPVDRMTKAALNIGVGNLSSRLPVPSARDELWSLAIAWNQLLDRLEGAVARLSKFSADASHDLRTSITVILATAQLSLGRLRSEEEYRSHLDRIVDECQIATTLLDSLLSLARSGNFVHEVALQRINVTELVISSCRRVENLAESGGIILDWKLPEEDLFIEGDELLLQRLLGILLDNAIKFTPACGEVFVEACSSQGDVLLTVRDTGVGMSENVSHRIFDRFYQVDLRERTDPVGSGLGLAIAKWIAEAHHAELCVESTPMKGSKFQLRFPSGTSLHSGLPVRIDDLSDAVIIGVRN